MPPDSKDTRWPEVKTCQKCGEQKALDEYCPRKGAPDGREYRCRQCHAASAKRWAEQNKAKAAAKERNKDWQEKNKRRRERHPEKHRAGWMVRIAVRDGRLVKPDTCENCGRQFEDARRLQGHHEDYSKPLEVDWLCQKCHTARHYPAEVK